MLSEVMRKTLDMQDEFQLLEIYRYVKSKLKLDDSGIPRLDNPNKEPVEKLLMKLGVFDEFYVMLQADCPVSGEVVNNICNRIPLHDAEISMYMNNILGKQSDVLAGVNERPIEHSGLRIEYSENDEKMHFVIASTSDERDVVNKVYSNNKPLYNKVCELMHKRAIEVCASDLRRTYHSLAFMDNKEIDALFPLASAVLLESGPTLLKAVATDLYNDNHSRLKEKYWL